MKLNIMTAFFRFYMVFLFFVLYSVAGRYCAGRSNWTTTLQQTRVIYDGMKVSLCTLYRMVCVPYALSEALPSVQLESEVQPQQQQHHWTERIVRIRFRLLLLCVAICRECIKKKNGESHTQWLRTERCCVSKCVTIDECVGAY